jgi:hypothetical protein
MASASAATDAPLKSFTLVVARDRLPALARAHPAWFGRYKPYDPVAEADYVVVSAAARISGATGRRRAPLALLQYSVDYVLEGDEDGESGSEASIQSKDSATSFSFLDFAAADDDDYDRGSRAKSPAAARPTLLVSPRAISARGQVQISESHPRGCSRGCPACEAAAFSVSVVTDADLVGRSQTPTLSRIFSSPLPCGFGRRDPAAHPVLRTRSASAPSAASSSALARTRHRSAAAAKPTMPRRHHYHCSPSSHRTSRTRHPAPHHSIVFRLSSFVPRTRSMHRFFVNYCPKPLVDARPPDVLFTT